MCRFVAYHGKKPIQLKTLFTEWANSLISQSRLAKESKTGLNGDGFGLGWYNHEVDETPARFRSFSPAWNDSNLLSVASKVLSKSCMAHVRASTVGDVSLNNCHPFCYKEFLFVHNGTIYNFDHIRKKILCSLEEPFFSQIKGQTDSEHFFFKLMEEMDGKAVTTETLFQALKKTLCYLDEIFQNISIKSSYKINAVLTNGKVMVVIRYSKLKKILPHSLYFSPSILPESLLIASEKLTESNDEWEEIPINHALLIEEDLSHSIKKIN